MDIKLRLSDLQDLLSKLSVPYSIEQINKNLFHIHIWHNGSKFRLRFSRDEFEDIYSFSGWINESTI